MSSERVTIPSLHSSTVDGGTGITSPHTDGLLFGEGWKRLLVGQRPKDLFRPFDETTSPTFLPTTLGGRLWSGRGMGRSGEMEVRGGL